MIREKDTGHRSSKQPLMHKAISSWVTYIPIVEIISPAAVWLQVCLSYLMMSAEPERYQLTTAGRERVRISWKTRKRKNKRLVRWYIHFVFFFLEKSMLNPLVCKVYPAKYIQTLKEMKKDVVECSSLCNITVWAVIRHRYAKNSRLYYPKIATLDSPNPDWRRILRLEPHFQTQALAIHPTFSTSRNRCKSQSGHSWTKSNPNSSNRGEH